MSDYWDLENKELLEDFFEEANLQLDLMEKNLLVLENDTDDKDCIDELFRAAHTLKGAAATVAMNELADFTHYVEDALDDVRDGLLIVDESVVDAILLAFDIIKAMLDSRLNGSVYKSSSIEKVSKLLNSLVSNESVKKSDESQLKSKDSNSTFVDYSLVFDSYELIELADIFVNGYRLFEIEVEFNEHALMNTVGGIQVYAILKNMGDVLKTVPDFEELNKDVFNRKVTYFVSTNSNFEDISDFLDMPDVIVNFKVLELTSKDISSGNSSDFYFDGNEESDLSEENDDSGVDDVSEVDEDNDIVIESKKIKDSKNKKAKSSILRVESKKIDSLLNLISESVINKSNINQLSTNFNNMISDISVLSGVLQTEINGLIESIPELSKDILSGKKGLDLVDELRDKYSNITDELNIFENKFKDSVGDLKDASQRLSLNTSNLQEGIMQIRMVPVSTMFSRFPRLVRDLSHLLNKEVNLVIEGEDTELDKSVVEDLLDPLIHCVRNSIDHGIELPDERVKLGKNKAGTVTLKASNEGSMVVIEITDDGSGIDPKFIRKKAIEKGLIDSDAILNNSQIYDLLFEPGFSTATEVTNVSGRGVGMDVVKTQIEKLKGTIQVVSEVNVGTTLIIRLPLTLAIIQGLLVRIGNNKYVIPVNNVIDSHRILRNEIKLVENFEVFTVRDEVIYILRLDELFGIEANRKFESYDYVVIVGNEKRKIGLIVDALLGEEDVVIKPLKDSFSSTTGIAGATILGEGTVALIMDILSLIDYGFNKKDEAGLGDFDTMMEINNV